jgi:Pyridoxamine 5'-phosphate oxidase
MPISEKIRTLIDNAWVDGYPCLLATAGPAGPNISPKGSMLVFDDEHLAYWERSKKQALENLGHDKRVVVIHANFKAQRDGVLESASCASSAPPNSTSPGRCARRSFSGSPSASRSMTAPTRESAC